MFSVVDPGSHAEGQSKYIYQYDAVQWQSLFGSATSSTAAPMAKCIPPA